MKRDEWEFRYSVPTVLGGARAKLEHHNGRLAWWRGKREEVIQRIRDSGLDVHESLAVSKSPGYGGAQIVIDTTMQKDLNEAVSKVQEHERHVAAYASWVEVLEAAPISTSLPLNHDDYLFFFGEGA